MIGLDKLAEFYKEISGDKIDIVLNIKQDLKNSNSSMHKTSSRLAERIKHFQELSKQKNSVEVEEELRKLKILNASTIKEDYNRDELENKLNDTKEKLLNILEEYMATQIKLNNEGRKEHESKNNREII